MLIANDNSDGQSLYYSAQALKAGREFVLAAFTTQHCQSPASFRDNPLSIEPQSRRVERLRIGPSMAAVPPTPPISTATSRLVQPAYVLPTFLLLARFLRLLPAPVRRAREGHPGGHWRDNVPQASRRCGAI